MAYDDAARKEAVQEVRAAAITLRKTLSRVRKENPNLPKFDIHVSEEPKGEDPATTVMASRLIITILADTQAHAEQHAADLEDEGCACQSTGETEVTCDCSDVA